MEMVKSKTIECHLKALNFLGVSICVAAAAPIFRASHTFSIPSNGYHLYWKNIHDFHKKRAKIRMMNAGGISKRVFFSYVFSIYGLVAVHAQP